MKVDGRTQLVLGVAAIGLLVAAAFLVSYMFAPLAILVAFMVVFGAVDRAQ